jgi:predicted NAD/FAD-dependent oxidoreductase
MKHRVVAVYDRDRGKGGRQGRRRRRGGEVERGEKEEIRRAGRGR